MSTKPNESSKTVWPMIRLGLILAVYAAISCAVLAAVNAVTAPVIALNNEKKANEAMKAVFPEADLFEEPDSALCGTTKSGTSTIESIRIAKSSGATLGAIVTVSGPTYDHATLMMGMDKNGIVTGVRFLENTDSPGFGSKASDPSFTLAGGKTFYGQFTGKVAALGFTAGKTFDAISGATITTNGVATLLSDGAEILKTVLQEE